MKFLFLIVLISSSAFAQNKFGYLSQEDQKYFKNDSFEGQNKMERIDLNVKEINKLHGEIIALKKEMSKMKEEIDALKNKK
jgi:hypothetical protein